MATRLSTEKSKEIMKNLIRESFEKIDFELDYIYNRADELIQTSYNFGLNDLAEELKSLKKAV